MKILYVTTIGPTMDFFKAFIRKLLDEGHTVDIATNEKLGAVAECYREWGCKVYPISCSRSPLNKGNLQAIGQLREIIKTGGYELVHCHTPIAAMCTRLACRPLRKKGVRVIYTAHGFHFYKGAPLKNWLIFYPIEKLCSYFTDVLITINKEDYQLAQRKMKAKQVAYVPGVGIDISKFMLSDEEKAAKRELIRQRHSIEREAKLLLSVGEVNENKNHGVVIEALTKLEQDDIYYIICGDGPLMNQRKELALSLGLENRVIFAGYREDVADYYQAADIFVFPSLREGLPVSVMEAMASGLPVISSNIRGSKDLVQDGVCGYLFNPQEGSTLVSLVADLLNDSKKTAAFSSAAKTEVLHFNNCSVFGLVKALYGL
ncbi:MAG: glycosyltransferase family 4 protein [Oscillospiraceae bacterium]|nr:glycosyltransferase family 4 protein [Oscillospiraceae bacterium]